LMLIIFKGIMQLFQSNHLHKLTDRLFIGCMESLSGFSLRMRCRMPVSVATTNSSASDSVARFSMPLVEWIWPSSQSKYIADFIMQEVDHPHSGWISTSASGYSFCFSLRFNSPIFS